MDTNACFLEKCRPQMKEDFYKPCIDFFVYSVNLDNTNCSFVSLVSKINIPETMTHFHPIPIINCNFKITKILAKIKGFSW